MTTYPGTAQHQALLQAIVARYKDDSRVLAVIVFGSLGRGNWDDYSDIDLDVVMADETTLDVLCELEQLCEALAALNERAALIIPDGDDAGDVVSGCATRWSLETALDIMENDLDYLANGQLLLTDAQQSVFYRVRQAMSSITAVVRWR